MLICYKTGGNRNRLIKNELYSTISIYKGKKSTNCVYFVAIAILTDIYTESGFEKKNYLVL